MPDVLPQIMPFISVHLAYSWALIIITAYMFFRFSTDIATNLECIFFRVFVVTFQGYTILDNIQTLREFNVIRLSKNFYSILCFLIFVFVVANTFCFRVIVTHHMRNGRAPSFKTVALALVPFLAALIMLTVSLVNGLIFSVDEQVHLVRGPAHYLIYLCAFIYLLAIAKASLSRLKEAETAHKKRESLGLILLVLLTIAWAIADTVLRGVTTIPILIFAVIFYLFISFQQSNIYTDTLTGMNNRRKAEAFLSGELKNVSHDMPLYMFMGDINGFKKINDNYGHHEGDNALIIFAEAVKKSANAYNGFAARYGGDEFVWAWRPIKSGDVDPEMVIQDIRHRVAAECVAEHKPYVISLSIGFVLCEDPKRSITLYLKDADKKMYADKQGHYRQNSR